MSYESPVKIKNAKLTNAIIDLLTHSSLTAHRYFGYFTTLIEFKERTDIDTACVSAKFKNFLFSYNEHFINKLENSEITYLIFHELMHIKSAHLQRLYGFTNEVQRSKCNIVTDAIINYNIQYQYRAERFQVALRDHISLIFQDSPLDTIKLDLLQSTDKLETLSNYLQKNPDNQESKKRFDKLSNNIRIMGEIIKELEINPNYDPKSYPDEENPYKHYIFPSNWEKCGSGIHLEPFLEAGYDKGENNSNLVFEQLYQFFDEHIKKLQSECDTIGYDVVRDRILKDNQTYKVHIKSHDYLNIIKNNDNITYVQDDRYTGTLDLYALRYLVDKNNPSGGGGKNFQSLDDFTSSDEDEISPEEIADRMRNIDAYCKARGVDTGFVDELMKQITPQKENFLKVIFSTVNKLKGSGSLNRTYKKINKKHSDSEFIVKGRFYDIKSLNIVCDVSGSMGGCVEPILGFCIKDNYVGNLVFCDTVVNEKNIVKIKSQKDIRNLKQLHDIYGGTELMPGINYVKQNFGRENLLILTDGYCDTLDLSGFKKVVIISCGIECKIINEPRFFRQIVVDPKDIINTFEGK
jgi:predicted metal-dependent peptidase